MTSARSVTLVYGKTGSGKTHWVREHTANTPRLLVWECFGEYVPIAPTISECIQRVRANPTTFRVGYDPVGVDEVKAFFEISRIVRDTTLLIEESDRLSPPRANPPYDWAVSRGRHDGTSLIVTSLTPFRTPPELRRQADVVVSFRLTEPSDLDYLAQLTTPGDAKIIRNLPLHQPHIVRLR